MAANRASITDLAKELNLSISTVSRALNDHANISDATKKRVWQLAKERQYQPNQMAAGLRKGRSNMLGVVVPHIEGQFFAAVVHGIETQAGKAGFNVIICQSNEDVRHERKNLDTLMSAQVEGILVSLSRTTHDFKHFEKVRRRDIPLVFFDRVLEESHVSAVVIDDYQGAYQITSHLIGQGARRIAHLAGALHLNIGKNRYQGYLAALRDHGLTPDETLVHVGDMSQVAGEAAMTKLLALPEPPDAVFSASDLSAVGAMEVLKHHGLHVPQDMLMAGFSNETFTSLIDPQLTSVDQCCEQMGQTAVRLFLEMLEHPAGTFPPRRIVLAPQILIRGSSQR